MPCTLRATKGPRFESRSEPAPVANSRARLRIAQNNVISKPYHQAMKLPEHKLVDSDGLALHLVVDQDRDTPSGTLGLCPLVRPAYLSDQTESLLQPETRQISYEQLVFDANGICSGLVVVEADGIDVDKKQTIDAEEMDSLNRTYLTYEQWSALIALHKTLLHEHHDFFLASQHPSASAALSRLAAKYSMPARTWRHGTHAFLEVLRHRLPDS